MGSIGNELSSFIRSIGDARRAISQRKSLLLVAGLFGLGLLGRLLLLLVLLVLGSSRSGQRALKNLEDLLVFNLLVRLEFGQVQRGCCGKLGDAVLRDS